MNHCRKIIYTIILASTFFNVCSQGCSDAGFCTMGAMKPDQPFNKKIQLKLRSMEVSFYRGTTTLTPVIYVATADMGFSLNKKTSFQLKVPYHMVEGRLANTSSIGDLSLCFTRNVYSTEKADINVSLGTKIPSNKSDKTQTVNGQQLPLPMYYQTSLGTYDFISGISYITRHWLFATGIQIPLNRNENQFLWGPWIAKSEEDPDYIEQYSKAKELKRGTDVMLRIEKNFRFSRFNFSAGLLPIYRITNDEITNGAGKRENPDGARGLAMSAIITAGYSFNVHSGIKLLGGHKIVQRDNNPDGLTRELVTTISYYHRF
jgi:hypothetical protein